MTTINFKFGLDQKVKTALGAEGLVTMLGYDDGGNQYYVLTTSEATTRWYKEKHLTSIDES